MRTNERYLSATEAAKALGVSTRTLKFYEQKGLVKPLRSEAGWRAYGTEALTRLHQILALKHMGLELAAIARLLKGSLASLDSVLALQEENLATRQAETYRALDLVRRARSRLSSGEALSVDDLTTLTRETTMDIIDTQAQKLMKRYWEKYFTPEEAKILAIGPDFPNALPGFIEEWRDMKARLAAAMKSGDASSPAALDVVRKSRVLRARYSRGDAGIAQRVWQMWNEMMADPVFSGTRVADIGLKPEESAFLARADEALDAHEAQARKSA